MAVLCQRQVHGCPRWLQGSALLPNRFNINVLKETTVRSDFLVKGMYGDVGAAEAKLRWMLGNVPQAR